MFKLILAGIFVAASLLFAFSMVFSYSKFQNSLNDIKNQLNLQNSNTQKDINSFKIKMSEYENSLDKVKQQF